MFPIYQIDFRRFITEWLLILATFFTGISTCLAQTAPAAADSSPSTEAVPQPQQENALPGRPKSVVIDSIAAVVNKDVITMSELNARTKLVTEQLKKQNIELPPPDLLQKQILERMIIESAQVQLAKEMGINVTDVQLDKSISMMAQQEGKTMSEFQEMIEKRGRSFEDFREDFRKEITMQRLRYHEVDNKIQVNDAEIENLVGNDPAESQSSAEVRLGHILIRIPENASPEQLAERRERAEKVLKLLQSGSDFQQNAASFSDADEGLSGGDIGWRNTDRLPQAFAEALANVPVGGITGIIRSPNGFHILKVLERRSPEKAVPATAAASNTIQQIHARHILIKVNQLVSADEARHKLVDLKQRIINNSATFEELAKTYSNDTSANRGGDLGWIYPGDTVPEFEKAMMALNIGEISDPVETQFGFHLIQVLEKKMDDVSQERKRAAAKQQIRERKIAEETGEWLRQLRDQVYVEYRLDNQEQ
ncbi:MAG: peptidylprolyl isomerase [Oxalobacter sp.]|nr:peptidylprolyl isomerase [Oxalobacter sp.]